MIGVNGGNYCVYKFTFPNGKHYIGQCRQPAESRWKQGHGYNNQPFVYNAIMKYGWENVAREIVYAGLSRKDAYIKEAETISKLNCNAANGGDGYNLSGGGEGGFNGGKHTEETKRRLSETHAGENNCFYGKTHTPEARQKISEAGTKRFSSKAAREALSKACKGRVSPMKGKKLTPEARKWLSEINSGEKHPQYGMTGSKNPKSKPVRCIETGVVYGCREDAAKALGLSDYSHIGSVCNGRRKSAYGYTWEYVKKTI